MKIYDRNSFTVLPAGAGMAERQRGLVPQGVSVIYVSVDEPAPRQEARSGRRLSRAAVALHRMADYVDTVRRSIERASETAHR